MFGLMKLIMGKEITKNDFFGLLYVAVLLIIIYWFIFGILGTIIYLAPTISALG